MKTICLIAVTIFPLCVYSQKGSSQKNFTKANLGFGAGIDYGGFGTRVTATPSKNFGIFGGLGYALAGVGFNGGIQGILNSKSRAVPYLTAMYGYNAALVITGAIEKKKLYYGPSFGLGLQLHSRRKQSNFLNIELLLPIRDPAFQDDIDYYKGLGAKISNVPPVAFSIGYHIGF